MKRNLLLTLALLALSAMLAACSHGSASSPATASPTEDAAPAEALTEQAASSEEKEESVASAAQTEDAAASTELSAEDAVPAEMLTEQATSSEEKEEPAAQTEDTAASSESSANDSAVSPESSPEGAASSAAIAEPAAEDGLAIPLDSLSAEPSFVDWTQDGTPMQLIALLDGNQVRLAYNTCQSCAGSPYAYFEYADGLLTCQNCGNQFGLDSVGAVVGGCNPLPVGEASIEGDSVLIPASELKSNAPAFANWKKFS